MSTRTHLITGPDAVTRRIVNPNAERFKSQIEELTKQIDALRLAIETGDLNHLSKGFSGKDLIIVRDRMDNQTRVKYLEQLENEKRDKENPPID